MANKAIFLDRDDTLISDPGYISDPDQVKLLDSVPEALVELKKMGYQLVVVSNQSAVARGIITEQKLHKIHDRLEALLSREGAKLDKIYYCPFHPEGAVKKYCKKSSHRKPEPGMILTAAKDMDIDLENSWVVGDSDRDVQAGHTAGCRTILLEDAIHSRSLVPGTTQPDYRAVNMKEVVNIIKKHNRTNGKMEIQTENVTEEKTTNSIPVPLIPTTEPKQIQESVTGIEQTTNNTDRLLDEILEQLKKNHRADLFTEFSGTRLFAGILQGVVPFCLLIALWFLMGSSNNTESILIALGFALVFQLMALTFFIMHSHK